MIFDFLLLHSYLSNNKLEAVPEHSIKGLPSLITLDLSFNKIGELPNSITTLSSLQTLYIDKNRISSRLIS